MTTGQLIGVGFFGLLIAFVVFAFRQGMKVKPHDNPDNWLPPGN